MPNLGVALEHDLRVVAPRRVDHRLVVVRQHPQRFGQRLLLRHDIERPRHEFQRDQLLEDAGRDADEPAAKPDQRRAAVERKPSPYLAAGTEQPDRRRRPRCAAGGPWPSGSPGRPPPAIARTRTPPRPSADARHRTWSRWHRSRQNRASRQASIRASVARPRAATPPRPPIRRARYSTWSPWRGWSARRRDRRRRGRGCR